MLALRFRFLAGRYHATPWGRHVNEAAVAWPPEPVRILRALIACHYRKGDRDLFSDKMLRDLIDRLAEKLPIYRLPEHVAYAHTRHYMPINGKNTSLVFDAFVRFNPLDTVIAGWPGVELVPHQRAHLAHLAAQIGYLGRAESWVEADSIEWDCKGANARPLHDEGHDQAVQCFSGEVVPLYSPLTSDDYRKARERFIDEERERRLAHWTKASKPTEKTLANSMKGFLATLPENLSDALAVDTADLQAAGWSTPPAMRRVVYCTPEPTTSRRVASIAAAAHRRPAPTVARFVLAGRPRPRVEDTVRIAEIMRLAAMAKFGWKTIEGQRHASAPAAISGYGEDGNPLRDGHHAHAFWLPEDADDDGEIDHVIVYAAAGLDDDCRRNLDRVTRLWIERQGRDDEGEPIPDARKEWRLALEGFGLAEEFAAGSRLLGRSRQWLSATPYLMPWHAKSRFAWVDQIARELKERGWPALSETPREYCSISINGRQRRPIHFQRFRSRRGLLQPDTLGRFVELTFPVAVAGPMALGFGCHFGLGLFRRPLIPGTGALPDSQ